MKPDNVLWAVGELVKTPVGYAYIVEFHTSEYGNPLATVTLVGSGELRAFPFKELTELEAHAPHNSERS